MKNSLTHHSLIERLGTSNPILLNFIWVLLLGLMLFYFRLHFISSEPLALIVGGCVGCCYLYVIFHIMYCFWMNFKNLQISSSHSFPSLLSSFSSSSHLLFHSFSSLLPFKSLLSLVSFGITARLMSSGTSNFIGFYYWA